MRPPRGLGGGRRLTGGRPLPGPYLVHEGEQPAQGGGLLGDAGWPRSLSYPPPRWTGSDGSTRRTSPPSLPTRRSGSWWPAWARTGGALPIASCSPVMPKPVRGEGGEATNSARPLSKRGTAQAEAIVRQLRCFDIDAILTSPAARCVETVAPLARARGLGPQISEDLWEEAGRASGRGPPRRPDKRHQASLLASGQCEEGPAQAGRRSGGPSVPERFYLGLRLRGRRPGNRQLPGGPQVVPTRARSTIPDRAGDTGAAIQGRGQQ